MMYSHDPFYDTNTVYYLRAVPAPEPRFVLEVEHHWVHRRPARSESRRRAQCKLVSHSARRLHRPQHK